MPPRSVRGKRTGRTQKVFRAPKEEILMKKGFPRLFLSWSWWRSLRHRAGRAPSMRMPSGGLGHVTGWSISRSPMNLSSAWWIPTFSRWLRPSTGDQVGGRVAPRSSPSHQLPWRGYGEKGFSCWGDPFHRRKEGHPRPDGRRQERRGMLTPSSTALFPES